MSQAPRVGTKRKRLAPNGGDGGGNGCSSTLRRGIPPATPRKSKSTASNNSGWSSMASVSPFASRTDLLSELRDDGDEVVALSGSSRRGSSSRNSLRKSLGTMTLEDPSSLKRSSSGASSTHQLRRGSTSNHTQNARSRRPKQQRSTSTADEIMVESDHVTDSSDDGQDTEDERLMTSAPTWQLHRLKKAELVRLNKLAGTWKQDADIDPELYTKQELVNGIIVCRSRLDKGVNPFSDASQSDKAYEAPMTDLRGVAGGYGGRNGVSSDSSSRSRSRRRGSARRDGQRKGEGEEQKDRSSDSDRSHEGGGEETEAEPSKAAATARRRTVRRTQLGTLRRMDSSIFDESELSRAIQQQQQQQQPLPRRQLRTRSALASNRLSKRDAQRSIFGHYTAGSDAANASSSSLAFTSSGISPLGHHALRRTGSKRGLFVASSPVRTRSRSRAQIVAGTRRRPMTRANSAAVQEMFGDMARTPRPNARRSNSDKMVAFLSGDDDGDPYSSEVTFDKLSECIDRNRIIEWEEDVDFDDIVQGRTRPRRHAKLRARAALQNELSADDADKELVTDGHPSGDKEDNSDGEAQHAKHAGRYQNGSDDDEEMDEDTPVKSTSASSAAAPARALRSRKVSSDTGRRRSAAKSSSPMVGSDDENGTSPRPSNLSGTFEEMDGESAWEPESPSKFRKLRNGKLRVPSHPPTRKSSTGHGSDDVDMETGEDEAEQEGGEEETMQEKEGQQPRALNKSSPDAEDLMFDPTSGALARLRRAQLVELCQARDIETSEDNKKADLIEALLQWRAATTEGEEEEDTTVREDNSDVDAGAESDSSASTAKQGSDIGGVPISKRRGKPSTTDSDKPLLLRTKGMDVNSSKLLTPPLTSNNEEANAPEPGDGVDELNGLDLESLNLVDKEIHPSKLEKLYKIGSGGFKDVYVGKYHISKAKVNKVAIADIRDQLTEMDIKELSLLRDLRHENIVRFIGVSIPEDSRNVPCMIVSELCSNGDMFDYIRNTQAPSDAEVFRILLETARGLEYLHTRSPAIIHRDCKSTNVLITRNRTAKINDFGLARVKNTQRSMMKSLVGTVNWQAVELWVPKPHYNEKVDVWSAGMTFWETLQWHQPEKKYPFQGMNEHQIYQDVGQKKVRPYTGFIRRQFGGEIVDLLDKMWEHSPKERPTMTEVCEELERLIKLKKAKAKAVKNRAG